MNKTPGTGASEPKLNAVSEFPHLPKIQASWHAWCHSIRYFQRQLWHLALSLRNTISYHSFGSRDCSSAIPQPQLVARSIPRRPPPVTASWTNGSLSPAAGVAGALARKAHCVRRSAQQENSDRQQLEHTTRHSRSPQALTGHVIRACSRHRYILDSSLGPCKICPTRTTMAHPTT
jgi:hypothetical protein